MRVKVIASSRYRLLATMDGDGCPAQEFILQGDANTRSWRMGLAKMLDVVSERGLANVPRAWCHEADKERGIYEFRKGALRLFFFKGQGNDIAVCTTGLRKDQSKADRPAVALADKLRNAYFAACKANQLEVLEDDAE